MVAPRTKKKSGPKVTKTYKEINERILKGQAVVLTAEEMIHVVEEKGAIKAASEVDVVTTGTFGPMCSSGAFLNFGHPSPKIKAQRVWLNNVPAYAGIAAVDTYLGATEVVEDDPFVVHHTLEIERSPDAGEVSGDVFCHENVVINVLKHFEIRTIDGRRQARTVRYSYHARYKGGEDILRYDNAHQHPGHRTRHHKHRFHSGGETVTHIGADWPHLSEVLDELKGLVWK